MTAVQYSFGVRMLEWGDFMPEIGGFVQSLPDWYAESMDPS